MKHIFLSLAFIIFTSSIIAQSGDCSTTPVTACNGNPTFPFGGGTSCGNPYGCVDEFPSTGFFGDYTNSVSNPSVNPASSHQGCLLSGESSGGATWVIINISSSGTLEFSMNQVGFQDWAMWPYDANACAGIVGNTLPPVRCNWNSSPTGGTGIGTPPTGGSPLNYEPALSVTAGQAFIICVTNFSSVNATINMNFTGTSGTSCTPFGTVPSQTICPQATTTLIATTNLATPSYSWNPGGLATASIIVTPPSTTVYTLTIAGTNTVTNTFTTQVTTSTVTVRTPPTLSLTSNSYVCPGSTINLAASLGFTNYVWAGPPAYSQTTTVGIASITNANSNMSGTYTVTGKAAQGGCTVQATGTIGIVQTATVATQSFSVCQGLDVLLTANAVGASSYSWSGPLGFTSAIQNPTITSISPNQAGLYTATATFTAGTTSCIKTNTSSVIVTPATTVALLPLPTICSNDLITLTAPAGADTYLWTGPNGFSSPNQIAVINNAGLPNIGLYNLTLITNGCVNTGTINVDVLAPLALSNVTSALSLCEGKTGKLNSIGSGGSSILNYVWSPTIDLASPNTATTQVIGNATTTYVLTLSDGLCPMTITPTETVIVTVNPTPIITYTTSNNRGCEPFTTDLISNSTPASANCMWRFTDGTNYPACSSGAFVFPEHGTYGAVLTVTDINGCVDSVKNNAFVVVDPKPEPDFTWNPTNPTVLQNNVTFYDQSTVGLPMTNWFWTFGDNFVPMLQDTSYQHEPIHTYDNVSTYTVSLEVVNSFGCMEKASKLLILEDEFAMYIPNAFTPHKTDGINDVFKVTGMGFLEETFEMYIYDRLGEKVFETKDLKLGWDGHIKGKSLGEQGVYTYKIIVLDHKRREKIFVGHITSL